MAVMVKVTRVRHKGKSCYKADVADLVCGRELLGMGPTSSSDIPIFGET